MRRNQTPENGHLLRSTSDHNRFDRDTWQPALGSDGEPSKRAQVAELTESVDLEGWPERTRFIARREPLHPGAQRTLFDSELWRYRGSTPTPTATPPLKQR